MRWFRHQPLFFWMPKARDNFNGWEERWPSSYSDISLKFHSPQNIDYMKSFILEMFDCPREKFLERFNEEEQNRLKNLSQQEEKLLMRYSPIFEIFKTRHHCFQFLRQFTKK